MSLGKWGILAAFALVTTFPSQVSARETVSFDDPAVRAGTIIVRTKERRLYYVVGAGKAVRYRVAVGRAGKQWAGAERITAKYVEPAWSPTAQIRRDNPKLPDVIAGGKPENPMGARAMTLSGDGQYAIHGTNQPGSIGTYASYGCVRMLNEDVIDLYERVRVGTRVVVQR